MNRQEVIDTPELFMRAVGDSLLYPRARRGVLMPHQVRSVRMYLLLRDITESLAVSHTQHVHAVDADPWIKDLSDLLNAAVDEYVEDANADEEKVA